MTYPGIARDPDERISPGRIRRESFEEIVRAIGVDLVKAAEKVCLSVLPSYVTGWQDLELAEPVFSDDFLGVDCDFPGQDRIRLDQLLNKRQVVTGLRLVIGENETVVPLVGRPRQKAVERRKAKVRRFPVLLCASA
jgi:hypothetical protein